MWVGFGVFVGRLVAVIVEVFVVVGSRVGEGVRVCVSVGVLLAKGLGRSASGSTLGRIRNNPAMDKRQIAINAIKPNTHRKFIDLLAGRLEVALVGTTGEGGILAGSTPQLVQNLDSAGSF